MTKDVIDSVIEAQAVALSVKNDEIKKLEERLKIAGEQIEFLQNKIDAGLYQNMIDQIQEDAVDALDDALLGREIDFRADIGMEGDTINMFDAFGNIKQIRLRCVEATRDVFVQSTAIGRQFKAQVDSTIQNLVEKILALQSKKLVFRRLPRPLPGTGALCASFDNKYGLRVIMSYSPNTLSNCLHLDVLCGGEEQ